MVKGTLASALLPSAFLGSSLAGGCSATTHLSVRAHDGGPTTPISPFIYGSNEFGLMDGTQPSVVADKLLRTPFRRLGGNFMSTYNWTNNTQNSGLDWHHFNGRPMAYFLELTHEESLEPASVILRMHRNSLECGAQSLVTLPLIGYVADDADGEVSEAEHAPSKRFVPTLWQSDTAADAPIDPSVCDIPQLLRRLVATFGTADNQTGIRAYALDNETGLWPETHPRIVMQQPTIALLMERSIAAAKVIKTIDPHALVFGPVSWGILEYLTYQKAPDWSQYQHYGNFLAAYLDIFRKESDAFGARLLDALDVHWYPQFQYRTLYNTKDRADAEPLLDSARSLTEEGFREDSWVAEQLPAGNMTGLSLPILPSLNQVIEKWYRGTGLALTEFNFGNTELLASGLATADVLGRLAEAGLTYACHWGPLIGQIGNGYALYRNYDGQGATFPAQRVAVEHSERDKVAFYAGTDGSQLHIIAINRSLDERPIRFELDRSYRQISVYGFDAENRACGLIGTADAPFDGSANLTLPHRSARHFVLKA